MCCRCCGVTQQKVWVFGIGTLFAVSGLLTIICWPSFIDKMVFKSLPLTPTSQTYDKWIELPIPVYMRMFLWNWTNPEEVKLHGAKPNFKQLGPYVYREDRLKMDVEWHANKTVTFKPRRTWFWEEELSGGKQSDLVTVPHLPSIAAADSMRNSPKLIKMFFNTALNENGGALYVTHTAREWLFDGFYDEFLHYAMTNPLAPAIETDHFAWFLNRNGSKEFEGAFTVHTGVGDIKEMGEIKFWNGANHTGWYDGDCGRLNGSTTDLFVPDEPLEKALTIFIADTCRIINLEFSGQSYEIEGIKGWKYEITPHTFDNGQRNGDMKCYCPVSKQQTNDCPASGATDLGPCADDAPMYLSADHFMYADDSYASTITGAEPNYERDNFFIIMERKLGVPLQVNAAVMISLLIEEDEDIDILKGLPRFYAPLFTSASQAIINKELASELKDLNNPNVKPNFEQIGPYTFSDYKIKEDLLWEQPTVTYYGRRIFHFIPELSQGRLDDLIITPSFPTLTAARYVRKYRRIFRKMMNFALNREGGGTHMKHTAGEWIFDGIYDSLIDFAEKLHSPLLPIYSDHFAWFYQRNNSKTAEGNFTIHTGSGDLRQMGELQMWNGTTHTGYYEGECGKVNGSTGELWALDRQYDETISIFLSDAARFINMYTVSNVTVHGIDAWRYETTELSFDNGQLNPDTKCFCVANRQCPLNGVLDFSPAAYHGPIYMSHPHFHMTDASYRENTTGLRPDASKHGMHMIMEPTLSIPISLKGQVMISVLVNRDEEIDHLKDVAFDHYAPLFVVQISAELDDRLISLLKLALNAAQIGQFIGLGLLLIGLAMLIVGVIVTKKHKWHNEVQMKPIDEVKVLQDDNNSKKR